MPTLKIRTQIILPFLLLMLILGVIGSYLSSEPVVQPVLRGDYDTLGDKFIGYVGKPPAALAAAGPVLLGDHVVGGVLLETPLAGVLKEMQAKAQAEVALLDANGRLLGSTVSGIKGDLIDQNLR